MKNNFYVLMSTVSFCLIGINLLSYSATQNYIISELNFTIVESAFIVSSFFLAYSLTQILGGVLSDKFGGENVIPGNIIVRQRGTKIHPGNNVGMGKDHSIYSLVKGKVKFKKSKLNRTFVSVIPN